MSNAVQEQALQTVRDRYDRPVMNNIQRGDYVECLVAELLGPEWTLPWTTGYDWAPWDLEHGDGTKIEIKQSAARQTWHKCESFEPTPPQFDIAPRTGYWDREGEWKDEPGRPADIYIFAWHPEARKDIADQRMPEQWVFYLIRATALPESQRRIALSGVKEKGAPPVDSDSLAAAVAELLKTDPEDQRADV